MRQQLQQRKENIKSRSNSLKKHLNQIPNSKSFSNKDICKRFMVNPNKFYTKKPDKDFLKYLVSTDNNSTNIQYKESNRLIKSNSNGNSCGNLFNLTKSKSHSKEKDLIKERLRKSLFGSEMSFKSMSIGSKENEAFKYKKEAFLKNVINKIKIYTKSDKTEREILKEIDPHELFSLSDIEDNYGKKYIYLTYQKVINVIRKEKKICLNFQNEIDQQLMEIIF